MFANLTGIYNTPTFLGEYYGITGFFKWIFYWSNASVSSGCNMGDTGL